MRNVVGIHLEGHMYSVWKKKILFQEGEVEIIVGEPRALGGQSGKTEGYSVFNFEGFYFFPSTYRLGCQKQN